MASNTGSVVGFKNRQAGLEQLASRDDHDVEARRNLVPPKNLSNQSLRSIPLNRPADLPGGRDPEAADLAAVRHHEHGAEPARDAVPPLVNQLKLGAAADPFGLAERCVQILRF